MQLSELRQEYQKNNLSRSELASNPFKQLESWLESAKKTQPLANAMSLATSNTQGKTSIRTVLLQSIEAQTLFFYTDYNSQKAQDMAQNPQIALSFVWLELEQQIQLSGKVKKTSEQKSQQYFASRPRESQLGAWASSQSSVLTNRDSLEQRYTEFEQKFANRLVPKPDNWGGYEMAVDSMEFWQGGTRRLHDRFIYQKDTQGNWRIDRLSP